MDLAALSPTLGDPAPSDTSVNKAEEPYGLHAVSRHEIKI